MEKLRVLFLHLIDQILVGNHSDAQIVTIGHMNSSESQKLDFFLVISFIVEECNDTRVEPYFSEISIH